MAGEKRDLIDTRGRSQLIPSRKRRYGSVSPEKHNARNQPSQEPPAKIRRPTIDLAAMLDSTPIPKAKYQAIQNILSKQERIIHNRGEEIRDRCTQIHGLKEQLSAANAKIDQHKATIDKHDDAIAEMAKMFGDAEAARLDAVRELRESKQYFQEEMDNDADLIQLGRKVLAAKNQENSKLRTTIGERDRTISALNNQIVRVSMASGEEMVTAAMESQAQRTLNMLSGLQGDLEKRDTTIAVLEAKVEELVAANESVGAENEKLSQKVLAAEEAVEAAEQRAVAAKAITEDQNKLIVKLMRDKQFMWEPRKMM